MSITAVGTGAEATVRLPAPEIENAQQNADNSSQVSRLNAEIKQAEAEMKEIEKEVQRVAAKSVNGGSEKTQMLQSKILMQQQKIMTKQLQLKEIELPKSAAKPTPSLNLRAKFDRYEPEQIKADAPDNVYRLEEKEGSRRIIFNAE